MTLPRIACYFALIALSLVIPPVVFLLLGYFVYGYFVPTVVDKAFAEGPRFIAKAKR